MGLSKIIILSVLAGPLLALAACGGSLSPASTPTANTASPTPSTKLKVATTNAILADFIRNVGGNEVEVESIVPLGADLHTFQSTPRISVTLSAAKVIISNGLGLDASLDSVINSAIQSDAVHVAASDYAAAKDTDGDSALVKADSHLWQNPLNAILYVERIRDVLMEADPDNALLYRANAEDYIQKLRDLDQEIMDTLEIVPPERRHLVTFHNAFGHFGHRYGWELSALAAGDASEVSPGAVATILEEVKTKGISAIFVEPQFTSSIVDQFAKDAGIKVGTIYSDTLDEAVPTYLDMMRFNARSLVEHLR